MHEHPEHSNINTDKCKRIVIAEADDMDKYFIDACRLDSFAKEIFVLQSYYTFFRNEYSVVLTPTNNDTFEEHMEHTIGPQLKNLFNLIGFERVSMYEDLICTTAYVPCDNDCTAVVPAARMVVGKHCEDIPVLTVETAQQSLLIRLQCLGFVATMKHKLHIPETARVE